jgi:hypothetical protein
MLSAVEMGKKLHGFAMVIRSRKRTLFWFAFTTAPLLGSAIEPGQDWAIVLALIALFGLQAFAAEFLGLQAGHHGISLPRRVFTRFWFPVLWRRKISRESISRVDSLGRDTLRFYLTDAEIFDVALPRRREMLGLLQLVNRAYLSRSQTCSPRR